MNVQDKLREPVEKVTAPPSAAALRAGIGARARGFWSVARRHPILSVALLAALLGIAGYEFYSTEENTAGKPIVATVGRGDIENVVTAIGSLQPLNFVDVGAQVSGQLKSIAVNVGDKVNKGDLVAEIDSTVAAAKVDADDAQLQNLRAQLLEKQAALALANSQGDRQVRLKADNATSQDALDSAVAAQKSADAQVKAVQAQITQSESTLKADQAQLGYAKIYAPMGGTISSIAAKQGQTLNANQSAPNILQVADLSVMTVSTQVSEADVLKLRVGMSAYFTTLGDPNRRWTGTLRQILPTPTVTNNVVLYTALFDVQNPNQQLMTQMTAQVFFITSAAYNVVTVPVSAIHYTDRGAGGAGPAAPGGNAAAGGIAQNGARQGGQGRGQGGGRQGGQGRRGAQADLTNGPVRPRPATVTVVKDDGTTETRNVIVGVTDRINAEIRSGLNQGEKIITGYQLANAARPAANANNNNGGRGGNNFGRGPGGFGGGFGGGAP